jgi:hypothetical protein
MKSRPPRGLRRVRNSHEVRPLARAEKERLLQEVRGFGQGEPFRIASDGGDSAAVDHILGARDRRREW